MMTDDKKLRCEHCDCAEPLNASETIFMACVIFFGMGLSVLGLIKLSEIFVTLSDWVLG